MNDKRKQSLYFPDAMLQEIQEEAARLDRSISWVVQYAFRHGRAALAAIPTIQRGP
jgi:uncharacterized small protein (TIGR04563 family)